MNKLISLQRQQAVAGALGSVRAEGLEPSASAKRRIKQYVQGKLTVDQLTRDTLADVKTVVARSTKH